MNREVQVSSFKLSFADAVNLLDVDEVKRAMGIESSEDLAKRFDKNKGKHTKLTEMMKKANPDIITGKPSAIYKTCPHFLI